MVTYLGSVYSKPADPALDIWWTLWQVLGPHQGAIVPKELPEGGTFE